MISKELETQSAPNKWWAARDARMRNYAYASTYSQAQLNQAERMKQVLSLVYGNREIHVNPREKFIAIKVDKPVVIDRHNLALLEKDWDQAGVIKRVTAQGVIYRIPRG